MDECNELENVAAVFDYAPEDSFRSMRHLEPAHHTLNLENLPNEIVGSVLRFCDMKDYYNLLSTSKRWMCTLNDCIYVKSIHYTPKLFEPLDIHKTLIIKSVKRLNVIDRSINEVDANFIVSMTKLKHLNLQGSRVKRILEVINKLPNLKSLNLSMCSVKGSHLAYLSSLSNTLVYLNLSDNDGIEVEEMQCISNLKQLKVLKLNNCTELSDEAMEDIVKLTSLVELHINNCVGLSDVSFQHIGNLPKLEVLKCRGCNMSDVGLNFIKNMKNLVMLNVKGSYLNWTKETLKIVKSFDLLERLNINGRFLDSHMKYISQLTRLLNLKFEGFMSDGTMNLFSSLRRLKKLEIHDCLSLTTSDSMNELFELKGLEQLKMEGCSLLEPGSLSRMDNFLQLSKVSINGSPFIDDKDAIALSELKLLTCISMQDTSITDAGVSQWHKLTNLRTLLLGNQSSPYGPKSMVTCNSLKHLTSLVKLKQLKIGNFERMEDHNWSFIPAFVNLSSVEIMRCSLREDDIIHFESLPCIEKLDISFNEEMNPICFKNIIERASLKYIYVGNRELWAPKDLKILLSGGDQFSDYMEMSDEEDLEE